MKLKKRYIFLIILVLVLGVWYALSLPKSYTYVDNQLPDTFEAFYQSRLAKSAELNARPGNEEKLIRYDDKTPFAILYIHGFSASRAEGEMVVDSIAEHFKANTYYLRLPGHGTNFEDHANATFDQYLTDAEESLQMMQHLGDKVIVVGTSMGGLVATFLAAEHPEMVDGLILTSPFYDYANRLGGLMKIPGMIKLVQLIDGPYRNTDWGEEFKKQIKDGYHDYWYPKQKYQALQSLEDLRRFVSRPKYISKVAAPTLMMYYYKDKKHQDDAASVSAMQHAYMQFESTHQPDTKNRVVPIEDGNHVLLSYYVHSDKELILSEIIDFIDSLK